jgi:double-strand break repair protein AddB
LARVTIHANSQRMRRRIGAALGARGVRLLPRMRLVSDLAQDLILADLPPLAPPLRRRLQLNQLIAALIGKEPDIAPASAVQDLTESLFALMEEMDSEGVEPHRIADLDVSAHSEHWARSRTFLNILVPFFAGSAARGSAARQRLAARRLAELWDALPSRDPVIVAGSTASRGAISVFMEAVARLPNGAVVLPGFDFDLPAPVWAAMDDVLTSEDHPQFRFLRLAERLGVTPADVKRWADLPPADPARNRVISLALRPAPVTDQWLTEGVHLPDLPTALAQVSLIEAASPRDEAQAIALILRKAVDRGQKAALITPDRLLTRRVTAALDRWALRPDDSAGRPLVLSAPGRFLRHLADARCEKLTAARLLVLLKHPMVMSGGGRGPHLLLTRELELQLRRHGPVFPTAADLHRFATGRDDQALAWAALLGPGLDDLSRDAGRLPLAEHVARHRALAETWARGLADSGSGELWLEAAGRDCLAILQQIEAEAGYGGDPTATEYRDLFAALLAEGAVQDTAPAHPVQILGAREARECGADLVILAGLNEGSWPSIPTPDPWLNRAMRKEAGLLLPERQIGLSAHDFQQAAGAPEVIFSRARRSDEAETVPARWLNRLTNLIGGLPAAGGVTALAEMRARGKVWLDLTARLDQPGLTERADPRLRPPSAPGSPGRSPSRPDFPDRDRDADPRPLCDLCPAGSGSGCAGTSQFRTRCRRPGHAVSHGAGTFRPRPTPGRGPFRRQGPSVVDRRADAGGRHAVSCSSLVVDGPVRSLGRTASGRRPPRGRDFGG